MRTRASGLRRSGSPERSATRLPAARFLAIRCLALGCLLALCLAATLTAGAARAAGRALYAGPSDDLGRVLQGLRPGDTLLLRPGVYRIGYLHPAVDPARPTAGITVTASEPSRPPLLQGSLKLFGIDYWTLSHLRIQATVAGYEALYIGGGTGWKVIDNEFFGASATGAYANVAIAGGRDGSPRRFRFAFNCVHDAGRTSRVNTDHNIYVTFPGSSGTGGLIDHNIIFRHPNGAGIKLGDGGAANARGPWGVAVMFNTVVDGGRQVLLTGDVRYNTVAGNILAAAHAPFHADPRTTNVYVNDVPTRTNLFGHNFSWAASMPVFDPGARLIDKGDNGLHAFPGFVNQSTCQGYQTTNVEAAGYGRWGDGRFAY